MHKNSLSLAVMIFLYNNNKCELCHITTLYANLLLYGWQEVSHNAKVEIYDKSSSSTHTQIPLKEICLQIKEICNSMKQEFCDKLKVMAEISCVNLSKIVCHYRQILIYRESHLLHYKPTFAF